MTTRDSNSPRPPALALTLLDRFVNSAAADMLVGDLIERFNRDCFSAGVAAARRRFWWESLVALREFGVFDAHRRSPHQENRMSSFVADLRHGARILRRAPAFAALCILTLVLAIGPTTAIVSVVDPLLIHSLPYPNADRLAFIRERNQNGNPLPVGFATVRDIRAQATLLQSVAAVAPWQTTISSGVDPQKVSGARVSWNYFQTIGVRMAVGRDFVRDEDRAASSTVVILSHGLWVRRFSGDSSIVGRPIELDGAPHLVAGVLPASYDDVVIPGAEIFRVLGYEATQPWACHGCRHLRVIARIRPGVPRERALAELNQLSTQIAAAFPQEYSSAGMFLIPMQDEVTHDVRPALLAIFGAVLLVLLIAVANVVNLQIARAVQRDGEFSVRVALGAGAGRLAQQLIAEGLIIAAVGGALGMALGWVTLPILVAHLPKSLPRLAAIHFDVTVLATIAVLVIALAIVLGLVPSLGARKRALFSGALRGGDRGGGSGHQRTRAGLVVVEMAFALMLLASAGLLAKSLTRLLAVDVGFDPMNLMTMTIGTSGPRYATKASTLEYRRRAMAAARAVPGVETVATVSELPLGGQIFGVGITAEDKPIANEALAPYANAYRVDGDYLRTMKIHLDAGRDFDLADTRDSAAAVAIVSASLAKLIWGSENPIGKRIHVPNAGARWSTVVGVAGNVRHAWLADGETGAVYLPEEDWQWASADAVFVARLRDNAGATMRAVRGAVGAIDPSLPITELRPMAAVVSASAAQHQLALTLFGAFAVLALLLSAAGIYGVLSGSIAERTREIGVRSALGAAPADLLRMVLSSGMKLAGAGVVLGLGGAYALTRYLNALLFRTAATDGSIFVAASGVLLVVAVIACLVPAHRAVRVDPMVALRQ